MHQTNDDVADVRHLTALGKTIFEAQTKIFERWQKNVRREIFEDKNCAQPTLVDTLPAFISRLTQALTPSYPRLASPDSVAVLQDEGSEKPRLPNYCIENMVREYQLLRAVLYDFLAEQNIDPSREENRIIHGFIDGAIHEAIASYAKVRSDVREKFITTLSHDLKNPLKAAQMATQMILRRPADPQVPELANRVIQNHKRMERMIQDLLDTALVRSGGRLRLEIHECDMLHLIEDCLSQAIMCYGDRFVLDGSSCVGFWDTDTLKRAFENLIGNAIKYGDPRKAILVAVHSNPGRVVVSFHNEGSVVPLEDQAGIFQMYRRTRAAKYNFQGWGVGLALVRGVAESHGGTVQLESSEERGTTFTLDLPLDARPFTDTLATN